MHRFQMGVIWLLIRVSKVPRVPGSPRITLKIGVVIDFDVYDLFLTFGSNVLCTVYKWE